MYHSSQSSMHMHMYTDEKTEIQRFNKYIELISYLLLEDILLIDFIIEYTNGSELNTIAPHLVKHYTTNICNYDCKICRYINETPDLSLFEFHYKTILYVFDYKDFNQFNDSRLKELNRYLDRRFKLDNYSIMKYTNSLLSKIKNTQVESYVENTIDYCILVSNINYVSKKADKIIMNHMHSNYDYVSHIKDLRIKKDNIQHKINFMYKELIESLNKPKSLIINNSFNPTDTEKQEEKEYEDELELIKVKRLRKVYKKMLRMDCTYEAAGVA